MVFKDYNTNEEGNFKTRSYNPNLAIDCRVDAPIGSYSMIKNLYFDHKSGMIKSIPGFRRLFSLEEKIYSIFEVGDKDKGKIYIHSGDGLYTFSLKEEGAKPKRIFSLENRQSTFLRIGERALLTDGKALYEILADEVKILTEDERIAGSTILAYSEGRLFLSGNPRYVGKIFYSEPIYDLVIFPEENYFPRIPLGAQITDILANGNELWVFKSYDDGDGGILCYSVSDSGLPYKTERLFSISCQGRAASFGSQIIFLSQGGVYAISPKSDGKREIDCISSAIAHLISDDDLNGGKILCHSNYIGIVLGSKIYLGDRLLGGNDFCGWFLIDGLGSYKNDRRVYRYSTEIREGYHTSALPDAIPEGEVISLCEESGETVYYEIKDGKKLLLYPTEEFFGGDFYPVNLFFIQGESIYFGTEGGDFCIFNTDEEFSHDHSFASHAPEYIASLRPDDCGLIALAKSSIPSSLVISLGESSRGKIGVGVKADDDVVFCDEVVISAIDFASLDFSKLSTSGGGNQTLIIPERAPSWREKQISIYGKSFGTELEIGKISFGYKIKGRLK